MADATIHVAAAAAASKATTTNVTESAPQPRNGSAANPRGANIGNDRIPPCTFGRWTICGEQAAPRRTGRGGTAPSAFQAVQATLDHWSSVGGCRHRRCYRSQQCRRSPADPSQPRRRRSPPAHDRSARVVVFVRLLSLHPGAVHGSLVVVVLLAGCR